MATEGTLSTREWKEALVQSFKGFSASQVSQHHEENARQCISNGGSYQERYTIIPFERILKDNQVKIVISVTILVNQQLYYSIIQTSIIYTLN